MSKSTKVQRDRPVADPVPEVLAFRGQFDERSPLDQIVRDGAQRMLQAAIEAEVDEFLITHDDRRDEHGNRLVVRNGRQPARQILTGAGKLEVQQPRVRDKSKPSEERVTFTSKRRSTPFYCISSASTWRTSSSKPRRKSGPR